MGASACNTSLQIYSCNTFPSISILHVGPDPTRPSINPKLNPLGTRGRQGGLDQMDSGGQLCWTSVLLKMVLQLGPLGISYE